MRSLTQYLVPALCWLIFPLPVFSQSPDVVRNYHSGNKLRLTFFDDATIHDEEGVVAEWPIGTGHEYLNEAMPVLVVEEGSSPRIVHFAPALSNNGRVAMSHLPDTWPQDWPDRPTSWAGQWNGYFGRGQFNADQESFYSLEDTDLGLRLKVRGWQWSHYLAQDMVILYYEITNTGAKTFARAAFGFFVDPSVGGDDDDDIIQFDQSKSMAIVIDSDNVGRGRRVARSIGEWSPVGRLGVAVLETPGDAVDGVDNDGDGLIDESRDDGIDNDGDWNAETDDVGADGVANTGDEGENDGKPTPGEPNYDPLDVHESDQIGVTSFAAFSRNGIALNNDQALWEALTPGRFDQTQSANQFILGSGYFSLSPGETQRFSVVIFVSVNEMDQSYNEAVIQQIYADNYRYPLAPPRPEVRAVPLNKSVTLYWDNRAEQAPDFEGYKIYKSTDPGFNDVFTVTNDRGIVIYSKPVVTMDRKNNIKDLFPVQSNGFRYFLGKNTGLKHWWTDINVQNGKTYYYAVVAFDHGDPAQLIFPSESSKSIVVEPDGNIITDINTVVVTPTVESSVYQSPEFTIEHTQGFATGRVEVEIVDRTLIKEGGRYQLVFDDSSFDRTTYSLIDVTDSNNPVTIFANSSNFSTEEVRNDADPIFDGLHTFIFDDPLAWDSLGTVWKVGDSNWSIKLTLNSNLGRATPVPADYEVRFGEVGIDTALFTTPIPVPFQVWNVTENRKENILLLDQNGDGAWSSGENIFIVSGKTLQDFRPVFWTIVISAPYDTSVTSIPPESGDVAFIPTFKPFTSHDVFTITTKAASAKPDVDPSILDPIAVVPNPYIVNATFEQQALFTGGQFVRKIQFIHLPPRCTIRIYNLRGRLMDIIEHDSTLENGSEFWDMRTSEGDVVAYGIYIYHVQAPGIGEKIGRFAIIR